MLFVTRVRLTNIKLYIKQGNHMIVIVYGTIKSKITI